MQSFSEIDITSKRASKAAGFDWGIAEEVGKNMRNLEMFGLPGVKNLNLYLQKIKKNPTEKPKKIEKENLLIKLRDDLKVIIVKIEELKKAEH